jgi:hypothetical protein
LTLSACLRMAVRRVEKQFRVGKPLPAVTAQKGAAAPFPHPIFPVPGRRQFAARWRARGDVGGIEWPTDPVQRRFTFHFLYFPGVALGDTLKVAFDCPASSGS